MLLISLESPDLCAAAGVNVDLEAADELLPPCGPRALRSSASGRTAWAWRWLCTPTPECRRWFFGRLEASRSVEAQL